MNIDWWSLFWQVIGSAVNTWTAIFAANPWPWVGLLALGLVGLLLPARARRRRY